MLFLLRFMALRAMVTFAALGAVAFSDSAAFKSAVVTPLPQFQPHSLLGIWRGNAYLHISDDQSATLHVESFNKAGDRVQNFRFAFPKAALLSVYTGCFSRSADGSVAICGSAYSDDNRAAPFLAIV